jgi:hypothetical protein
MKNFLINFLLMIEKNLIDLKNYFTKYFIVQFSRDYLQEFLFQTQ